MAFQPYRLREGLGLWEHRGKVAAVGIGHSPIDRRWDERAETSLGAYGIIAATKALEDAGVTPDQVDGVISAPGPLGERWAPRPIPADFAAKYQATSNPEDGPSAEWLAKNMGLTNVKYSESAPPPNKRGLVLGCRGDWRRSLLRMSGAKALGQPGRSLWAGRKYGGS